MLPEQGAIASVISLASEIRGWSTGRSSVYWCTVHTRRVIRTATSKYPNPNPRHRIERNEKERKKKKHHYGYATSFLAPVNVIGNARIYI